MNIEDKYEENFIKCEESDSEEDTEEEEDVNDDVISSLAVKRNDQRLESSDSESDS